MTEVSSLAPQDNNLPNNVLSMNDGGTSKELVRREREEMLLAFMVNNEQLKCTDMLPLYIAIALESAITDHFFVF